MSQSAADIYKRGYYYYKGSHGYPLDYRKALECFENAANLGLSFAMNQLGVMYEKGEIVSKDYRMAFDWYYRAFQADSQDAIAIYNLGRMFYSGTGVEKNYIKAYKYCKMAVDLGVGNTHSVYPQSCYYTGCILLEYYKNNKEAYPYFIEAAKYGDMPEAWHNLGWLCEKEVIPIQNTGKGAREGQAISFYKEAAARGYVQSIYAIGRLYFINNMPNEARPWLEKAASMGYEPAKKCLKTSFFSNSSSLWDLLR